MAGSENKNDNDRVLAVTAAVLLIWLVLAFILGAKGSFVRDAGAPPLPILAGVLTPILVFLAAFRFIGPFRDFVMSLDLQLAAGIQANLIL